MTRSAGSLIYSARFPRDPYIMADEEEDLPPINPVLIAGAPERGTPPGAPLFPVPMTGAGGLLTSMIGCHNSDFMTVFDRLYLLPRPIRAWPSKLAKDTAANLKASGILAGRQVILLGKDTVWSAFTGVEGRVRPFCAYGADWCDAVYYCPAPSVAAGAVFNNPNIYAGGKMFFRELLYYCGHELSFPGESPN